MSLVNTTGLILEVTTLRSEVLHNKVINGDYAVNPDEYTEEYSLLGIGIYNFLGLNVNGMTYLQDTIVNYDKNTGKLKITGFIIESTDVVSVLFNKLSSIGNSLTTVSIPVLMDGDSVTTEGDFENDPDNYKEYYDLTGMNVYKFIGISLNIGFYCHPDSVSYNPTNKMLTVTGLKLEASDNICLMFNRRK